MEFESEMKLLFLLVTLTGRYLFIIRTVNHKVSKLSKNKTKLS